MSAEAAPRTAARKRKVRWALIGLAVLLVAVAAVAVPAIAGRGDAAASPYETASASVETIEVVASGVNPATVTVEEIMAPDLVVANERDDLLDTLTRMRAKGIRRLPVVNGGGTLVGILSLDDVLGVLAEQVDGMVKAIAQEQAREARTRK